MRERGRRGREEEGDGGREREKDEVREGSERHGEKERWIKTAHIL